MVEINRAEDYLEILEVLKVKSEDILKLFIVKRRHPSLNLRMD